MGYRTCYYRTLNVGSATSAQADAYTKVLEWIDAAIALVRPGMTMDRIASVWPRAQEFGFALEMEALGLKLGHGLRLALHERQIISELVSLDNPFEFREGWFLFWKPIALPRTATARRALRRKWW